tara:strand:- start:689 stop:1318 length:630 start_codon:yes stop_codon:yes gene_type:complete
MIKQLVLLTFHIISSIDAYNLCVVGAGSGLGREIVYQASKDRNMTVLALTTSEKLCVPFRGEGYNNIEDQDEYISPLVTVDNYWKNIQDSYECLVICTGGSIFDSDYSDKLTLKYLENLPESCKDVSIVSAYSVEDNNLEKFSIPFQIMGNVYLKDVYRAKREQERLLKQYNATALRKKIFKPRALSYGNTLLPSTPRMELAEEILDTL